MTRLRQLVDAISMLPDVEQHAEGRAAVLAELDCDIEWKRCTRQRQVPRFYAYDGDEEEDEYEPDPIDEQRAEHRRHVATINWLEWINPLTTTSYDAMLRVAYPAEAVTQMAMQRHPFFSRSVGDAIEMRSRSYAGIITPLLNSVFKVDV